MSARGAASLGPEAPSGGGRGGPGQILLVSVVYTIISALPLFLATALSTRLQADLSFGAAGFGAAVSISFLAAVVSATPIGPLVTRYGTSWGFRMTAVCSSASLLWLALGAQSWLGLSLGLAICGVAASFAQVVSSVALAEGVERRYQGRAFGIKQAAVPATSLSAAFAMSVLGAAFDWRLAFLVPGLIVAAMVLWRPAVAVGRRQYDHAHGPPDWRRYLPFAAIGVLAGAVGTFLPTFAVDSAVTFNFSASTGALLLALGSAVAGIIRVVVGQVVDYRRSNGLVEMAFLSAATVVCLLILILGHDQAPLFAGALVIGIGVGWGSNGLLPHIGARLKGVNLGTVMSVATSSVYLGNILGPLLTGFMVESSYLLTWLFVGLLSLAAMTVSLQMERRMSRSHEIAAQGRA